MCVFLDIKPLRDTLKEEYNLKFILIAPEPYISLYYVPGRW